MLRGLMLPIVASLPWLSPPPAYADEDSRNKPYEGFELLHGSPTAEFRPRYNRIDEDDKPERTEGVTYRLRLGWRTAPWSGWRFLVEGINTGHIGPKDFNDDGAQIASSPYPLLPDPDYTGLNQAHVEYTGIEGLRVRAGRQVMRLENQRWVSDNDFRQIPQVFDGVRAVYSAWERTELEAAYFSHVRTTSGDRQRLDLTTLRAAWNPWDGHALAAYGVFHDQAQNGAFTGFADNSYQVVGVRAEGAAPVRPGIDAVYVLEAAKQKRHASGDPRIDASYWRAGAGLATDRWTLRFDQEVKGSNNGLYGVQMPLTDFYAFNGWTLHFFNTPRQGLRDRWATARLMVGPVTLYGEHHRFRADYGGADLGRETDLGITVGIPFEGVVRLQHARYDAPPGPPGDVRKTWLTATWVF